MSVRVANEFPSRSSTTRIAFIGEAPGSDETRLGRPFIGSAGKLLDAHLSAAGISRAECFVGNLCQHQPPGNQLAAWAWSDPRIQDGIAQLLADLRAFQPYLIVTLGNWPLHLFKHGNVAPARTKAGNVTFESKVGVWRGSLFLSHETLFSHPYLKPELVANVLDTRLAGVVKGSVPVDSTSSAQGGMATLSHNTLWPGNADPAHAPTHGPVPPRGLDGAGGELDLTTPSTHYPQLPSSQGVRACAADTVRACLEDLHTSRPANAGPDCPSERYPSLCASGGGVAFEDALAIPTPLRFKCLSTLHPAFVLRAWSNGFDLRQDLLRAREEGRLAAFNEPIVDVRYGPSAN